MNSLYTLREVKVEPYLMYKYMKFDQSNTPHLINFISPYIPLLQILKILHKIMLYTHTMEKDEKDERNI